MKDPSGKPGLASMSSRAMSHASWPRVVVIDAGFCGLAAAYELGGQGIRTTVLECDDNVGELAGVVFP